MSKLSLKTQNTKGGNPLWKADLGYAALFIEKEGNGIIADAFEGQGNTYKRREKTQIIISKDGKQHIFSSFDALFNRLQKTSAL